MFTGIITDLGDVISFCENRLEIRTSYVLPLIPIGASVACDGACLTVVEKNEAALCFDVSAETLARTTLGDWKPGRKVNLERPVQAGGEFGGHFVTGHVDGVGHVTAVTSQEAFILLEITFPETLRESFVTKGSVAINGVSLTVNQVTGGALHLTVIPHTAAVTNLSHLQPGHAVNLEIDLIARYIAPYLQDRNA